MRTWSLLLRCAVLVGLLWTPAVSAADCKGICEDYFKTCRKDCASGDDCARQCEDDQEICTLSCKRTHGNRRAIEQDVAARRRQREKAPKAKAKT